MCLNFLVLCIVGGTFALYSLLCRNAKVGLLPSEQIEDQEVSNYQLELPSKQLGVYLKLKNFLEKSVISKYILLLVTMLSTSLVIGDGVLTPSISGSYLYFQESVWLTFEKQILFLSVKR